MVIARKPFVCSGKSSLLSRYELSSQLGNIHVSHVAGRFRLGLFFIIITRCPNGEFRLCFLYLPLCPSLSLLFPPYPLLSLSLPLSVSYSPSLNLHIPSHCSVFTVSVSLPFCVWERVCVRERQRQTQRYRERVRYRKSDRDMPCLWVRTRTCTCMDGVSCAYWRRQYLSTEAVR